MSTIKTIPGVAWSAIEFIIINPIIGAYNGIVKWFNKIVGWFSWLLGRAIFYVNKIRGWLAKLNPATRFSPPLTTTVMAGFELLGGNMADQLAAIEEDTRSRVVRIRDEVSNLRKITPAGIGGGLALAPATGGNIEINVTTLAEQNIADEVAWAIRIS